MIATADGAIELTRLKPAGKASMSGRDYLNGNPMPDHIIPSATKE
jgi:methionyl-tRNA formyltransferase